MTAAAATLDSRARQFLAADTTKRLIAGESVGVWVDLS
jgi:hypothetical protein